MGDVWPLLLLSPRPSLGPGPPLPLLSPFSTVICDFTNQRTSACDGSFAFSFFVRQNWFQNCLDLAWIPDAGWTGRMPRLRPLPF